MATAEDVDGRANTSAGLATRDFWLQRAARIAAGAAATAEVLGAAEAAGSGRYRAATRTLTPETATALDRVTAGNATLCWTAATAATALVLRRLGADDAVVITSGAPLHAGLPVLLELTPGATFRQWLGTVRHAVVEVLAHAGADDALLARCFCETPPIVVDACPSGTRSTGSLLDVAVAEGQVSVGSAVLGPDVVEMFASAAATVLEQGLAAPDRSLADIGILDEEMRRRVLVSFNETSELDASVPFRDLVLARASERPEAVAVRDEVETFDYAQLCARATAIALRLREAGLAKEELVAVALPRDAWFLVVAVGVLFANGAYVPIDPAMPAKRREQLMRGARIVIGDPGLAETEPLDTIWIHPGELRDLPAPQSGAVDRLGDAPDSGDLAYVMFTSGSTGVPKGASVEHRSFLNLLATRVRDYGLRAGTRVPQTAPLTFDLSIWQLFAGLTCGATVWVVSDETVRDPAELAALAIEQRFSCMALVPTFIAVLLDQLEADERQARELRAALNIMISTGEILTGQLARRWHAVMPGVELLNAYGPAEVADDSTGGPVGREAGPLTTIGRVLPNVRVYVLDRDLQPVPPEVVGEIYIGGVSVGRGYHGEPALTAAAFLPDPFDDVPGRRMYRTRDRGRWRPDGGVELLGRADNQVKIRGRRVELGEVEHVLEQHDDVSRAVLELIRDDGVERLTAFVTAATGDSGVLGRFAEERLPDYMVPSKIIFLDTLPRNNNGKIDRKALRALESAARKASGDRHPPRTPGERILCQIWAEHLKLDRVGVHDDFFALGGDSILGIRIVQQAARQGLHLRPRHVLRHRTVAALAAVAEREKSEWGGERLAPEPAPGETVPLTPAQRAFFERRTPRPDHWNHAVLYSLRRETKLALITTVVDLLARRHTMLRARITPARDGQTIADTVPPVSEFDLRGLAPEQVSAAVHERATELHTSLDLTSGPVCRVGVFRLPGDRPDALVVVCHHLVIDLYSWSIITQELVALLRDGDDRTLPSTGTSYRQWAIGLARHVADHPEKLELGYWDGWDTLRTVPVTELSTPGVEGRTLEITTRFAPEWTRRFVTSGTATGTTVYERLLTGLGPAFQEWLGVPGGTLPLQLGGHGREEIFDIAVLDRTVGYFNTAYPFALPLPGRTGHREYLAEVAAEFRRVPRWGLDYEAGRYLHPDPGVRTALAAIPRPQVLFNFWGEPAYLAVEQDDGTSLLGEARVKGAGQSQPANTPRPFPIEIYGSLADGHLTMLWRFSGEAFPADRARELTDTHFRLLHADPIP
ncbi:non-ribosomal peptide synthetase [Actinomadura sp. 6K520]|uniref:non-ribosomal peptide synthetase n=1 Tax=Actinomadura sp. 6K520 TaxID=2530364 RepID=UPI001404C138|nr:non-ribosomal peptide synthetase [Actinomadura sp. 6K520]